MPSFKRDYDTAFGKIADILSRYGIIENPRNLRFRFSLCKQEFFDSIPPDQWEIKEPAFIKRLGILIRSLILFPPISRSIPAACAGVIPFGNPQAKGMTNIEITRELQVSEASISSYTVFVQLKSPLRNTSQNIYLSNTRYVLQR